MRPPAAAPSAPEEEDTPASQLGNPETGPAEDGGPSGPSETEETSFLAAQQSAGMPFAAPASIPDQDSRPADAGDLPPLDDLVQRIPAETRSLIDELFRAKFVGVKRLPRSAFKP